MLTPIDDYFLEHEEPVKSCLQALRDYLLNNGSLTEAWKYGMPFYCYNGKMMCYLWTHKKNKLPYLGLVDGKLIDHPDLVLEKRARMKIFFIDPTRDLPTEKLNELIEKMIMLRNHVY